MWRVVAVFALGAGVAGLGLETVQSTNLKRHQRHVAAVAAVDTGTTPAGQVGLETTAGSRSGEGDGGLVLGAGGGQPYPWGLSCHEACACQEGLLKEVPLRRLLESHSSHLSLDEATLRSQLDGNRTVRQAVCVILSDVYREALDMLPRDTQALTLLQSADDTAIVLTSSLLSPFGKLLSLEVTAFAEGGIVLQSDALRTLQHLMLLSLTGVRLEGAVDQSDNEVLVTTQPPLVTRRRRLPPWAYRTEGQSEDTPHLVFLKPSEVVPFSKFSELRRMNAMRTFEGLERLLMLRLHHSEMVDLAWEMFSGLENLQVLSLQYNGLAYVPDWSLYGLPSLRHLSFAHNNLLDVSSTALVGLLELRFLDLSYNNLTHLSELSLPPFPSLVGADFRGNPIDNIYINTFLVMNTTEALYLGGSGTALQLRADMFQGLVAMRRLSASDVSTPAMQRELLRGMPRLRELTLKGAIYSLPYDAFVEVPKLERLVLRQCEIRHVSMDAFYALFALRELDLSDNHLAYLPPSLLDQQSHLRELLLSGNQLKELPPGLVESLPAKMVRLDGNPWECSCDMAGWNPSATNKEKREGRYVYEKRAAPRCAGPERYAGWDVYDAMRRGFRCNKNPSRRLYSKPNALPVYTAPSTSTPLLTAAATSRVRSNHVLALGEQHVVAAENASEATVTRESATSTPVDARWSSKMATPEPSPAVSDLTAGTASPGPGGIGTSSTSAHPSSDASAGAASWTSDPPSSPLSGRLGQLADPTATPTQRHLGQRRRTPRPHMKSLTHGDEGTLTKDGKYLLSDGKGGYIAVSKKAFKAAMEERRNARRPTTRAPIAA